MATQVTGVIGNQPVELNNAATETTLAQLLAVMQRTAPQQIRALQQIATSSGISPAAVQAAELSLRDLANSADMTTRSVESSFSRLPNITTPIFADLTNGLVNTTKNLFDFSMMAVNGTNTVAGFFKVFEQLPFGLGLIASLFRSIAQFNEPILSSFRLLSDVGMNTSSVYANLRSIGTDLGLSVDEFGSLIKENSEIIARMGVSAGQGANAFLNFAKGFRTSNIGDELLSLGFSLTNFNRGILDFISITGGRTADQLEDRDRLRSATAEYLMQLDKLSQLTGKSREEQARQLKEAAMNEAYRAKMMTLGEEEQLKATIGLQNALMIGGKDAMDAFKSQFLGLAPLTEGSRKFSALNAEAAAAVRQTALDALDSSKTVKDINKSTAQAAKSTIDRISAMGTPLVGALSMLNTANSETVMNMQKLTNILRSKGLEDIESIEQFLNSRPKTDAKMVDELLAMEEQNLKIRQSFQQFMEALSKGITPAMLKGLEAFSTGMSKIPWEKVGESIGNFIGNIFDEKGREKIAQDISKYFEAIINRAVDIVASRINPFSSSPTAGPVSETVPNIQPFGPMPLSRQLGSLGATGKLFEDFGSGTPVILHGKESVTTPDQMNMVVNSAINKSNTALVDTLHTIKIQNTQILTSLNNIAENTRRTYGAARNLDSNLFVR